MAFWRATPYTVHMGIDIQADDIWLRLVATIIFLAPIAFVLLRVLYTQVQAHLLEFMLILIVSMLPMGLMLNLVAHSGNYSSNEVAATVLIGLYPLMVIFAGSLWALSAARRLREERTWPRLGLLLLGWTIVPSLVCLAIGVFELCMPLEPKLIGLLPGSVPFFLAALVEHKCRVQGEAQGRPEGPG